MGITMRALKKLGLRSPANVCHVNCALNLSSLVALRGIGCWLTCNWINLVFWRFIFWWRFFWISLCAIQRSRLRVGRWGSWFNNSPIRRRWLLRADILIVSHIWLIITVKHQVFKLES